ncbi:MAG: hypothetical protein ACXABY_15825 [Candidatus Thorarchaeota archaeon]|jgi:hypothetical protein
MVNTNNNLYLGNSFFAEGQVVPDLLTEQEAIHFLRLDVDGPKDPAATLKHYRDKGLLRPTRVGQCNKYLKTELLKFLHLLTDRKNGDTF